MTNLQRIKYLQRINSGFVEPRLSDSAGSHVVNFVHILMEPAQFF
jgi:hypothetical protein